MASAVRAPDRPLTLTESDRALLVFAAEHRFVLAGQVAHLLQMPPEAARRRLGRLRAAGLLRAARPLRHEPSAYSVTRRGLALVGSPRSLPRPLDLATYRHDVGVAWLAVGAHRGRFGELTVVVSERRMRSEDQRRDGADRTARHGIRLGGAGGLGARGGPRLHYPDLTVVTASGHRVAFELELSTKAPARRERILAAYDADPRVDAVVYLVNTRAAGDAIARSAARAGATGTVSVQRFDWTGGRAPGEPPRAITRAAAARDTARDAGARRLRETGR